MKSFFTALPMGLLASVSIPALVAAESWIQIEAHPTEAEAIAAAEEFGEGLPNVAGFATPNGWYVITVGPYADRDEATQNRRLLRNEGLIPSDSFVRDSDLGQQVFALDVAAQTTEEETPAAEDQTGLVAEEQEVTIVAQTQETAPQTEDAPATPTLPEETLAEARASEQAMSREEKKDLQRALQFAGFYNSTIDGSYGRGTRAAMSDWQGANGYEVTGVMTSRQRAEALAYRADTLKSLSIEPYTDDVAGISLELPLGLVEFDSYVPPFAKFKSKDGSGVEVLLISQTGDQASLTGLYEVMQTLEVVPVDGPRSRKNSSFTLSGANDDISSHTEVALENGQIKGWTLIWPAGDEKREQITKDTMRASFERLEAVLPDVYGEAAEQSIDLLAGLKIRRPERAGTGFFVDMNGAVLTDVRTVENCDAITLNTDYYADIVAQDDFMALLKPKERLAPMAAATFDSRLPRLQSEVTVSGYAYEGRLGAPSLNYGLMAEHMGLNGEEDMLRLTMATLPGEAGGPVFNTQGAVIGMLKERSSGDRTLPEDVSFAYDMEKIVAFLGENGITVTASEATETKTDPELIAIGQAVTTLVSCWN